MSERTHMLLFQGKAAAKAQDIDEARMYLEWSLRSEPDQRQKVEAFYWLSEISNSPKEKRSFLEDILMYQPTHFEARRSLAMLDDKLKAEDLINPDIVSARLTNGSGKPATASLVRQMICPQCSARMVFTPDGAQLYCEHCQYSDSLPTDDRHDFVQSHQEQDFILALATMKGHSSPQMAHTFDCDNCGHGFLVDSESLSLTCPFCQSVYVIKEETFSKRKLIPPQAIVPFKVSFAQVTQMVKEWSRKRDLPASYEPQGVYIPAFTFDIGGALEWRGQQVGENRSGGTVSGSEPVHYDDMLVPASKKPPRFFAEELAGYDMSALVAYDPRYLANWPAEIYDIPVAAASLKARRRVLDILKPQVRANLTGDRYLRVQTVTSAGMVVESYKLILLPVWVALFKLDNRMYTIFVNGQNGRLRGQMPARARFGKNNFEPVKRLLQILS